MEANDARARSVQRIILAEDDDDMRRFLVKALEKAGYDVVSFGNGLEAYERLKEEPFTLLLTDIVMPEMDGLALADRALATVPRLRVVLMTGHAPELTAQLDLRASPLPVLLKPFTAEQLLGKVRDTLADRRH